MTESETAGREIVGREIVVGPADIVKFAACRAQNWLESCQHCSVLTVGLYVMLDKNGNGWWICTRCGRPTEVKS